MNLNKLRKKADYYLNHKLYKKAIALYQQVIAENPLVHEAQYGLAACYVSKQDIEHIDDAIYHVTAALKVHPTAQYLDCAVLAFLYKGNYDVAIRYQIQATRLEPTAENIFKLSDTYKKLGDYENAEAVARSILATSDDALQLPMHMASILLTSGRYLEAWPFWEWRRTKKGFFRVYKAAPYWDGVQDLNGKIIFIYGEQGFGDIIQFSRFVITIKQRYPDVKIIYEASKPLYRLLSQYPVDGMVYYKTIPDAFDYHVSVLSLATYLGIAYEDVPLADGYLSAEPMQLPLTDKKRIGIVWHGQDVNKTGVDKRRNVPLEEMSDLFKLPNIEWYLLQLDNKQNYSDYGIIDITDKLTDFSETASLIMSLDAVVAIDSAVAHLAGALNKKVFVLSRMDGCWRWGCKGETTIWYSSAVVIRQTSWLCWKGAVQELVDKLKNIYNER